MEWLKKLLESQGLSEEQIKTITEGVENNYKGYVPEHRFEEVNNVRKQAENDLKERDKQLETLRKSAGDNEALKGEIQKLQDENKAASEKYETEMASMKISNALKLALKGEVHDADLVANLIIKDNIKLKDDGTIESGFEEQVKSLRENKGFLFVEKSNPKPTGWKPADTGGNKGNDGGGLGESFAKAANDSGKAPAAAPNPWG